MNKQQHCVKNGEDRRKQTLEKVFKTIETLKQKRKPITLKSVAKDSGVSLSWFYKHPEIRIYIESLGKQTDLVEEKFHQTIQHFALKLYCLEKKILNQKAFFDIEEENNL